MRYELRITQSSFFKIFQSHSDWKWRTILMIGLVFYGCSTQDQGRKPVDWSSSDSTLPSGSSSGSSSSGSSGGSSTSGGNTSDVGSQTDGGDNDCPTEYVEGSIFPLVSGIITTQCTSCHFQGGTSPDLSQDSLVTINKLKIIDSVRGEGSGDQMPPENPLNSTDMVTIDKWECAK